MKQRSIMMAPALIAMLASVCLAAGCTSREPVPLYGGATLETLSVSGKRLLKMEQNKGRMNSEVFLDLVEEEDEQPGGDKDGKFGDPDNIPRRDTAMAEKIDVKNIGLADLLSNKIGRNGAISEVLNEAPDDMGRQIVVINDSGILVRCRRGEATRQIPKVDGVYRFAQVREAIRECEPGITVIVAAEDRVPWVSVHSLLDEVRATGFNRLTMADAASVAAEMM